MHSHPADRAPWQDIRRTAVSDIILFYYHFLGPVIPIQNRAQLHSCDIRRPPLADPTQPILLTASCSVYYYTVGYHDRDI